MSQWVKIFVFPRLCIQLAGIYNVAVHWYLQKIVQNYSSCSTFL